MKNEIADAVRPGLKCNGHPVIVAAHANTAVTTRSSAVKIAASR